MYFELKNPLFYPAFGVSMLLHSLAVVLLSQVFLAASSAKTVFDAELTTMSVSLSARPSLKKANAVPNALAVPVSSAATVAKPKLQAVKHVLTKTVKSPRRKQKIRQETVQKKWLDNAQSNQSQPKFTDLKKVSQEVKPIAKTETAALPTINAPVGLYPSPPIPSAIKNNLQQTSTKLNSKVALSSELPPIIKSYQPSYPEEARWEERAGKVTLSFQISVQGGVESPKITHSSGHRDLDLAAIQALSVWRFDVEPQHSQKQWYSYSFRFELD